ncbi:MAG TPA: N-acetylmuramoyl-L-alanine amidase [Bryobacteraceae bacterium]|nr:N-acetylmuramoyl-L-alanine amidase [Bryobacteraceae bacterium]
MAGCISERRSKVLAAGVIAAVLCLGADAPSKVTAVRFWSLGDVTRVAIEVSSEFRYKSDRLSNPDRLFFDIQGAKPQMVNKGMHVIAVGDTVLKQIRVAEKEPGVTRVVLDLEQVADFTASQLSSPDRLMIELRLKDRPAPPATPSVTGARTLTDPPVRAVEADLIAPTPAPKTAAFKPEPKKFEPPPVREVAAKPDTKPELLTPPSNALVTRTSKVAPPGPPVTTAIARGIAPPPDPVKPDLAKPDFTKTDFTKTDLTKTTAPPPEHIANPAAPAAPAKRNSNGDRSLTRVLGLKLGRVVLDPGHGGNDVGTHGSSGLYEKEVVLDVAKRLGAILEDRLASEVVFTRSSDTYVALEERTRIANDRKADLFLSIHANSSPYRAVAGVETYYLNFTTSKAALDVAARENASSEQSVFDLKDLLQKIALKDKIDESREFATRIESSLYGLSSKSNPTAKNRGVKKAPFVVLIGASMPSVLAEIGFLTNASDEGLLRKSDHRQKIAEALYKGVAAYADTLSHFQVAKRD